MFLLVWVVIGDMDLYGGFYLCFFFFACTLKSFAGLLVNTILELNDVFLLQIIDSTTQYMAYWPLDIMTTSIVHIG